MVQIDLFENYSYFIKPSAKKKKQKRKEKSKKKKRKKAKKQKKKEKKILKKQLYKKLIVKISETKLVYFYVTPCVQQDTWRNGYKRWFPKLLRRQSSGGCRFNPHCRRVTMQEYLTLVPDYG